MNPTLALLHRHRSIRRFRTDEVPDEHLREAVRAGQMASTSSAVQAYSVIRVRDATSLARLAEFTGGQRKVAECGAFLLICGDVRRHRLACERAGVAYDQRLEAFVVATIDAALFAQNLCVALESMGYGICYIGGVRNHLAEVDRLLEIPHGVYPLFGLCVGVPDESPAARPRLPVDSILFDGRYPDDATLLATLDAYDGQYERYLAKRGAAGKPWTAAMAGKHGNPERTDLGRYYTGKGADLS